MPARLGFTGVLDAGLFLQRSPPSSPQRSPPHDDARACRTPQALGVMTAAHLKQMMRLDDARCICVLVSMLSRSKRDEDKKDGSDDKKEEAAGDVKQDTAA